MPQPDPGSPLNEALRDVEFPISREDLLRRYGDVPIFLHSGEQLSLESALARVRQPEFKSVSDITLAIGELNKSARQTHL